MFTNPTAQLLHFMCFSLVSRDRSKSLGVDGWYLLQVVVMMEITVKFTYVIYFKTDNPTAQLLRFMCFSLVSREISKSLGVDGWYLLQVVVMMEITVKFTCIP